MREIVLEMLKHKVKVRKTPPNPLQRGGLFNVFLANYFSSPLGRPEGLFYCVFLYIWFLTTYKIVEHD
jgi:hypothetical protein